jgi:hypothetical protein
MEIDLWAVFFARSTVVITKPEEPSVNFAVSIEKEGSVLRLSGRTRVLTSFDSSLDSTRPIMGMYCGIGLGVETGLKYR